MYFCSTGPPKPCVTTSQSVWAFHFPDMDLNTWNRQYPDWFGPQYSATNWWNLVKLGSIEEGPPMQHATNFQHFSFFPRWVTAESPRFGRWTPIGVDLDVSLLPHSPKNTCSPFPPSLSPLFWKYRLKYAKSPVSGPIRTPVFGNESMKSGHTWHAWSRTSVDPFYQITAL